MASAAKVLRLRALSGWGLVAYRILWAALAILAIPNLIHFPYRAERAEQQRALAWYKVGVQRVAGIDPRISPSSEEARAKDIRLGDALIAIDGHEVGGTDYAAISALLAGPDNSPVRLTIRRDGDAPRTVTLTRDARKVGEAFAGSGLSFSASRWTSFGIKLFAVLFSMIAAAMLFARRPRDPVAGLLSASLLTGSTALFMLWPDAPDWLQHIFFLFPGVSLLVVVLVFPSGRLTPRWTRWVALAIAISTPFLFLLFYVPWLYMPLSLLFYTLAVACLAAQIARFRAAPAGIVRQQLKFALLGFAISILLAIIRLVPLAIERSFSGVAVTAWCYLGEDIMTSLGDIAMVAGLLISLLRYRLYDADALISRSAAYAALTLLIGAIFAGSEKVIEVLGEEFFGEQMRAISAGLGAAVAATLIAPLHHRIHSWTENRFQRPLALLKRDLPRLVGDMREVANIDRLLATIGSRIERGLRATRLAILLVDEGATHVAHLADVDAATVLAWRRSWQPGDSAELESDRDDPLFPVRLPLHADGMGIIGWILLGPRPDGSFYGKDEREAIAEIADPIACAIDIVRQRDAREAILEARLSRLEMLLQAGGAS